jgi:CBS domain-containing protein
MKHPVETLLESDPIQAAAERMRDAKVGFLPVCNTAGIAVGVLTDRDIVIRSVAEHLSPEAPVGSVMTREVVSCRSKDTLVRAIGLMRERHLERVLCVDVVGRPVGVISLSEVARYEDGIRMAKTVREIVLRSTTAA